MARTAILKTEGHQVRCLRCGLLTMEEWVHRLNKMAQDMDEVAASMHPSGWHEALANDREAYSRLALAPTCECDIDEK